MVSVGSKACKEGKQTQLGPCQAKPLDISMDLQFGTFMCHCIMELHVIVTNDRYTIWICDKNTHVWVLKSQFHKNY